MKRLLIAILLTLPTVAVASPAKLHRVGKPVPGEYIVLLNSTEDARAVAEELSRRHALTLGFVWEHALNGFSYSVNPQRGDDVAASLADDVRITSIEENPRTELEVSGTQYLPSGDYGFWGLDRLDNVIMPWGGGRESGSYFYTTDGGGVPIYIVDTGVRGDHVEFGTRVATGYNAMTEFSPNHQNYDPWPANNPCGAILGTQPISVWVGGAQGYRTFNPGFSPLHEWTNGHGTAVASIAAGATYGAAKGATIIPVTVFDCDEAQGTGVSLLNGLNWIARTHDVGVPGVVNISAFYFGGAPTGSGLTCPAPNDDGQSPALDAVVDNLVWFRNVVVTTSANNQGIDARCTVPARVGAAITVGGTMRNDTRLNVGGIVSNHGPAIDFFGPAENIASAHLAGPTARRTVGTSGTSFASPFAAGCAARYRKSYPGINAADATTNIIYASLNGILIGDLGPGSLNRFLHCPTGW